MYKLFSVSTKLLMVNLILISFTASICAQDEHDTSSNVTAVHLESRFFFQNRKASDMTVEGLQNMIDACVDASVTRLFLCVNGMKANLPMNSREAIWESTDGTKWGESWPINAKILYDKEIDPYAIALDRCRELNISPWVSVCMNDTEGTQENNDYRQSRFWKEHPEFRIDSNASADKQWLYGLNYAKAAVRDYNLAFLKEIFTRYDFEGLELDMTKSPCLFKPGTEKENALLLTEYIRCVRDIANLWELRRGHEMKIGIRIPSDKAVASALGLDIETWKNENLVDLIIPSAALPSEEHTLTTVGPERISPIFADKTRGQASGSNTSKANDIATVTRFPVWPSVPPGTEYAIEGTPLPEYELWNPVHKTSDVCLIIFPGGGYRQLVYAHEGKRIAEYFCEHGITCVVLRYRVPRPAGIEKHIAAWQDAQRVVRIVRSQADVLHINPEKIGAIGFSAGGHLALMVATSSSRAAYESQDDLDNISCHVNFAIPVYPAYVLEDGYDGRNTNGGNNSELVDDFAFDENTPPLCLFHGDSDYYSPMGSVAVYHKLRTMHVPAELHIYANVVHGFGANATDNHVGCWLDQALAWISILPFNQKENER